MRVIQLVKSGRLYTLPWVFVWTKRKETIMKVFYNWERDSSKKKMKILANFLSLSNKIIEKFYIPGNEFYIRVKCNHRLAKILFLD